MSSWKPLSGHDAEAAERERAIALFLKANIAEMRSAVDQNPILLTSEAQQDLIDIAEAQSEEAVQKAILNRAKLLRQCSEVGVEAAFDQAFRKRRPPNAEEELQAILDQLSEAPVAADITQRAALLRRALALCDRATNAPLWALLQGELANCLAQMQGPDRAQSLEDAIKAGKEALDSVDQQRDPEQWALLQMGLGGYYFQRKAGDHGDNVEESIERTEKALLLLSPETNPIDWAAAHMNVALAYGERVKGDLADNVDRSIIHYQAALKVRTRQSMPMEWATTQMNLGMAWLRRVNGDEETNTQQALIAFEAALSVFTEKNHPAEWAFAQMGLGLSLAECSSGDAGENIEEAIAAFLAALRVLTRETNAADWATSKAGLGWALAQRKSEDHDRDLEQAIDAYQAALTVLTKESKPKEWANTQANLASALRNRTRGDKADQVERAIACYDEALSVRTREAMPTAWATTTMNQAICYLERVRGDRTENVELAIAGHRAALEVLTRENNSENWAEAQHNLANALLERTKGNRGENVELAIAGFESALTVLTREDFPRAWAAIQTSLAQAYERWERGDPAENLERAISGYEAAMEVATQETSPAAWAAAQANLAAAYVDRMRGEKGANLERANDAYQNALLVQTRAASPTQWAATYSDLMLIQPDRTGGNKADNIELAIHGFHAVLEVFTRDAMPSNWASAQLNLGNAYQKRLEGEPSENFEAAIHAYEQALEVFTREAFPMDWAQVQGNLANAYAGRIAGERAENVERAITSYRAALQIRTPEALPSKNQDTQLNLGLLFFAEERWQEAADAFRAVLAVHHLLYSLAVTQESQHAMLRRVIGVSAMLAYSLAKTGQAECLPEAVESLENGRARLMTEGLNLAQAVLERATPEEKNAFESARERSRVLQSQARLPERGLNPQDFITLSAELRDAHAELSRAIEHIRAHDPEFLSRADFSTLKEAAAGTPIVYLIATAAGGAGFVINGAGDVRVIWLPQLTEPELRSRVTRYLAEYNRLQIERDAWLNELDSLLSWLWDRVMGPLLDALKGHDEAILIPGSLLGLLPLHAAWTKDAARPSGRRYALDTVNLRFAPNARVLEGGLERQTEAAALDSILAFSNPEPVHAPTLSCAEPEVDAAVSGFAHARVLAGKDASLEAALREIANYPVLHFACHGASDFVEPLNGGLVLAEDAVLTLRHFLDLSLPETRLAILSACATGVPSTRLADEVFSLPSGLLGAGVKGVIASLWPVADRSTMMLMTCFYQFWRGQKLTPAAALQSAQMWVRDTSNSQKREYFKQMLPEFGATGPSSLAADTLYKMLALSDPGAHEFASPFHWAAFTYTGV